MKYLLDTHIVIWFLYNDSRLTDNYRSIIENPDNEIFVSIASFWEMAIKISLQKLNLEHDLKTLYNAIIDNGISVLDIEIDDLMTNMQLEFHHRDPFDRILISQAKSRNYQILSEDQFFGNYITQD